MNFPKDIFERNQQENIQKFFKENDFNFNDPILQKKDPDKINITNHKLNFNNNNYYDNFNNNRMKRLSGEILFTPRQEPLEEKKFFSGKFMDSSQVFPRKISNFINSDFKFFTGDYPEIIKPKTFNSSSEVNKFNSNETVFSRDLEKSVHQQDRGEHRIKFNQGEQIIDRLNNNEHVTLNNFVRRFDGLCELICNRVLKDDLLGAAGSHAQVKFDEKVNVQNINKKEIKKSHLIDTHSKFRLLLAYFFGLYPSNKLSFIDQKRLLVKNGEGSLTVDEKILKKGLETLKEGQYIKLEVFWKDKGNFSRPFIID